MVVIIGIALGVFTVWGLANPFVGLIGLLFAAIVQPGELYPIFGTLHVETLMALITLLSLIAHGGALKLHLISKRLLYFWGSMWFAVPLSFWPGWAISFSLDFGHTVLYHVLIANLVNTARRFKVFVVTFILLVGWHAASAVWLYSSGVYYSLGGNLNRSAGLTSLSDQPNSLGLMIVAAVPLACLGLWKGTQTWLRLLTAGLLCLFIWAILTTNSRASFFSLVLLFGIYAFTRKRALLAIPIVAIVMLIGWQIMPQEFKDRYTTDLKTDDSYLNRVRAWEAGKAMFFDNPLTGVGPGCFTYANGGKYWVGSGRKIWLNAHSLFVQLPAELGVVGVITFTLFLGAVYRENKRLKKILADNASPFLRMWPIACSYSLLAWLIAGYSSHDLYRGNWFMLAALTAAAAAIPRKEAGAAQSAVKAATEPELVTP